MVIRRNISSIRTFPRRRSIPKIPTPFRQKSTRFIFRIRTATITTTQNEKPAAQPSVTDFRWLLSYAIDHGVFCTRAEIREEYLSSLSIVYSSHLARDCTLAAAKRIPVTSPVALRIVLVARPHRATLTPKSGLKFNKRSLHGG